MIDDLILLIVAAITILVAFAQKPTHAYCGNGWYADHVSANGFYTCRRTLPYELDPSAQPYGWRVGWISCSPPRRAAIGIDGVSLLCR